MEKKALRVLIVDDSSDDADRVLMLLKQAGYISKSQRVQGAADMQQALAKTPPELIISEFGMPQFGAPMALDQLRRFNLDLPFIVVTRGCSEEDAAALLRAGAHDVIAKTQLLRLPAVIERELRAADTRRELIEARAALKATDDKHRALVDGSQEAICYAHDGMYLDANRAYLQLFGYDSIGDLSGIPVLNMFDGPDQARAKDYLRRPGAEIGNREFTALRADGTRISVEITATPIDLGGESCTQLVVADISRRKTIEGKLQFLSQHDPLTGLYNRHHFLHELTRAVERGRSGRPADAGALLYLHIDQLKEINNNLGYAAGDRLLLKLARMFRDTLPASTIVARFGGNEFTILLPQATRQQAEQAVVSIQKALHELSFAENGKTYRCQGQFSLALIDQTAVNAQQLLTKVCAGCESKPAPTVAPKPSAPPAAAAKPPAAAVAATRRTAGPAANHGLDLSSSAPPPAAASTPGLELSAPGPIETGPAAPRPAPPATVARPAVAAAAKPAPAPPAQAPAAASEPRSPWVQRIQTALAGDTFRLVFQPIVNLHADAIEQYEVLVRLREEDGGLASAGAYLAAAEDTGLGGAIDRWVIGRAAAALQSLHRSGRNTVFFINISRCGVSDDKLAAFIGETLTAAGLPPASLIFEINESSLVAVPDKAAGFVRAVKALGCGAAVDHFGSRLEAIPHLRQLPVDHLKIDGELIGGLAESNPAHQKQLKTLVDLARSLGKTTIAMAVEDAQCLSALWGFGIDYVQGYYFQPPDTELNYEFAVEDVSSDHAVASWVTSR